MLVRHVHGFTGGSGAGSWNGWGNWWKQQHQNDIAVNAILVESAGQIYEIQEDEFVSSTGETDTLIWRASEVRNGFDPNTPDYTKKPEDEAVRMLAYKYNFLWPPELNEFKVWLKNCNEIRTQSNEGDVWYQNMSPSEWWGRYGLAAGEWAKDRLLKVILFSPSSGDHDENFWSHPMMLDCLQFAAENRDHVMIGLHEYSYVGDNLFAIFGNDRATVQDVINADGETLWKRKIGRFKFLFDTCDRFGIDWPNIYFPEWGWAYGNMPETDEAMQQIQDAVLGIYGGYSKYIKGYGTWYLTKWQGTNIDVQTNSLLQPCANLAVNRLFEVEEKKPAGGGQPPVGDYKSVVVKIAQEHSVEEWQEIAEFAFNDYKRTMTASHDNAVVMVKDGNEESYLYIVDPSLPSQQDMIALCETLNIKWEPVLLRDVEPPPSLPDYIDVVSYNQRDSRWANDVLGTGTKTMSQWGCLLVAYTMLADHFGISDGRTPDLENEYYTERGGFSGHNLISMAMSHVYPEVKNEGWKTVSSTMHTKTKEYLAEGIPVPARVDFNPNTDQWEQHWVLLVGWDETRQDYLMNNPWDGTRAVYVKDHYWNGGILECIYYYLDDSPEPPPIGQLVDTTRYFEPLQEYGRYTVFHFDDGRTQPQQFRRLPNGKVIMYKGEGQWFDSDPRRYQDYEEWEVTPDGIKKYTDTSDAGDGGREAYTLNGEIWIPRTVEVGKTYISTPQVTRFNRTNCQLINNSQTTDYLHIKEVIPVWTSPKNSAIQFNDVLVIEWRKTPDLSSPPIETYKFAKNVGYVEWNGAAVGEIPVGRTPLNGELSKCNY